MSENGKHYDAVIIGAGPGGLSAGLSLAGRGLKVLIAEKNARPGGNCTCWTAGGYTFDLAVHQLSGVGSEGMCGGVLKEYGVSGVEFRQVDPFLVVEMPDRSYRLPGTRAGLRAELVKDFPGDAAAIDSMLSGLDTLKSDALISQRLLYGANPVVAGLLARAVGWRKLLSFPFTFPWGLMLRMPFNADFMIGRWLKNPRLRAVLHASWVYLGLPPSRISGVMMDIFVAMQHIEHSYYPVGGSQKLADAMASAFLNRGGELLLASPVARIICGKGRAKGIELAGGEKIYADLVISNADARHTYGLLDQGQVPARFSRKLKKMAVSLAPFRVCLGLDYDVSKHGLDEHEYMLFRSYDHDANYADMLRGEPGAISVYSPAKISPELAPPGHSTLVITPLIPWPPEKDWRGRREELAAELIAAVEKKLLPGLSAHIKVKQIMTPEDLERLTNASEGAMYGWANTPDQVLMRRMSMRSPVEGLYHTGHWTYLGTGVTTAIISGWMLGNRLERRRTLTGKIMDRLL